MIAGSRGFQLSQSLVSSDTPRTPPVSAVAHRLSRPKPKTTAGPPRRSPGTAAACYSHRSPPSPPGTAAARHRLACVGFGLPRGKRPQHGPAVQHNTVAPALHNCAPGTSAARNDHRPARSPPTCQVDAPSQSTAWYIGRSATRFSAGTPPPAAPSSVLPRPRWLSGLAASVFASDDRRGVVVISGGSWVPCRLSTRVWSARWHPLDLTGTYCCPRRPATSVRALGRRRGAAVASATALSTRGATQVERRFRRRRAPSLLP